MSAFIPPLALVAILLYVMHLISRDEPADVTSTSRRSHIHRARSGQ